MYDKTCTPHEKNKLYKGIVPENVKEYELVEHDMFYVSVLSRNDFPFVKENGDEQNYYGWYMLIPDDKELLILNENNGSPMNFNMLKLKDVNGEDLIIERDGIRYFVYGKFNIAKTSDNWSLKIVMNKI